VIFGTRAKTEDDGRPIQTIEIPPITIVLATDHPGLLANAIIKRMPLNEPLLLYPVNELREIVDVIATQLKILMSPQSAGLIAKVSHGVPRTAEHHLHKLWLWCPDSEKQQLGVPQVTEYLHAFDVDDHGFGEEHHRYLMYLREIGTASLESLAIFLGTDEVFVRHQIEHPLMLKRFIVVGKRGRQLSHAGRKFLEMLAPSEDNLAENLNGNDQGR
jgi:Holliday junction DNA helicase RuvB